MPSRESLIAFIKTFKTEDFSFLSITAFVTYIGKVCAGVVPVFALAVVIYQLRIQRTRLKINQRTLEDKEKDCK